jgi:hypothetical protein
MATFLSFLSSFACFIAIAAYVIFMGWVIGNAIEYAIRATVREEIREHDERRRRLQAEIEGK